MHRWWLLVGFSAALAACGDDSNGSDGAAGSAQAGSSGSAQAGSSGSSQAGSGGSAQAGGGGSSQAGGGGSDQAGSAGSAGSEAGGSAGSEAGGSAGSGGVGGECGADLQDVLGPVDAVSQGAVAVQEDKDGVKTLAIDATAGGTQAAASNPRTYLALATGKRVDLTDVAARTSSDWDLSFKRAVVFTNSGDGGPGKGGAVFLAGKALADVTAADAASATFAPESFVDSFCDPKLDPIGALRTSLSDWYDYDDVNHTLTPKPGTFVVRSASGALFKLQFVSYYGTPDGGPGKPGGNFVVKIAPL